MEPRTVTLDKQLNLEWAAESAELFLPIALVSLTSAHDHNRLLRLDLDKQRFLDTPPEGISDDSALDLAEIITGLISHCSIGLLNR